jgi:hypothetical protein
MLTKNAFTRNGYKTFPNFNKHYNNTDFYINKINLKLKNQIKGDEPKDFFPIDINSNSKNLKGNKKIHDENFFMKTLRDTNTNNNYMQRTILSRSREKEIEKFNEFKNENHLEDCLIVQNTQEG